MLLSYRPEFIAPVLMSLFASLSKWLSYTSHKLLANGPHLLE